MRKALGLAVVWALSFWIGTCVADWRRGDIEPRIIVDSADATRLRARLHAVETLAQIAMAERDGLRGAMDAANRTIRALEARRPQRIVIYDTIIQPDTVILHVEVEHGRANIVGAAPDSAGHRPVAFEQIDIRDCDDGMLIRSGSIICDRPRFGHLELFGGVGARTTNFGRTGTSAVFKAGAEWSPSFRSTFRIRATARSDETFEIGAEKGVRFW